MEGTTYTIKEIMEKSFNEVNDHLVEIKEQVKKTNGRVNSLETSRIQIWTAISVFTVVTGTIIYLSVYVIDSKINNGIAKALQANISRIEIEK